ncbi:hypothetical protein FN846DRAFT_902340 [Sphaerosporella brunnea]|uniref:Uncharacterized protein n=1 Tax=Sphaerosporella brunnea TaxID=1250544 RepID=A0A5J5FAF1_9PEZI|nr:hypothetical protein FN846DRAFT_902340 [Sphaerosporella brunnea]
MSDDEGTRAQNSPVVLNAGSDTDEEALRSEPLMAPQRVSTQKARTTPLAPRTLGPASNQRTIAAVTPVTRKTAKTRRNPGVGKLVDKAKHQGTRGVILERDGSGLPDVEDYEIALALSVNRALNVRGRAYTTAAQLSVCEDFIRSAATGIDPAIIGFGHSLEWMRIKGHSVPVKLYLDSSAPSRRT